MKIIKQTGKRTWIEYTQAEADELKLELGEGLTQVWHNMYDGALRGLMARGVPFDRAVRFILCRQRASAFHLSCWLAKRFRLWGVGK